MLRYLFLLFIFLNLLFRDDYKNINMGRVKIVYKGNYAETVRDLQK